MTIEEFLNRNMEPNERKFCKPLIHLYLETLAKLKQNIYNFNW
jgi:hypothetical protein